ncbi:MAG TPA: nucleotidyltransferase domain-containing protein [Thermoanaerobaculia bacterium]
MALPAEIQRVVDSLVEAARASFGESLRSVILYGSAAEGRLRATSDVNLLFILSRFDGGVDAFREPYRFAQAAANVAAMFVLEEELADAAEAFAQKFADISRRHVVLHGEDLVANIEIPRRARVRRLQQSLLNLTMRLRASYVESSLREEQCAIAVADAAGPLRAGAASILELEGGEALPPKEALERLVRELPQFEPLLPRLSEAREQRVLPAGQAAGIMFETLELARALHERSHRLTP